MHFIIKKKLQEWLSNHIIDQNIYDSILKYEEEVHKTRSLNRFRLWLFIIAGFSIGLGILSIIAANWEYIPSLIKFILLLSLHIGIGFFYLWLSKNKPDKIYIKEILLVIFSFLFLGEIALTSQVFQLEGEFYLALIFWGFLMIFISMLSETTFLPLINFGILFVGIFYYLADILKDIVDSRYDFITFVQIHSLLTFFIIFFIYYILQKFIQETLFKKTIYISSVIVFIIEIIWIHITWYWGRDKFIEARQYLYLLEGCTLLLFIPFIFVFYKDLKNNQNLFKWFLINIFIFIMNFYLSIYSTNSYELFNRIIGTLLFLIQCTAASYFFQLMEQKGLYRFFIFLILFRLFLVYIELFKDLTLTGFGLIGLGLLILFLSYVFIKINKIIKKVEK
jgi:uncharacterized membrane protein